MIHTLLLIDDDDIIQEMVRYALKPILKEIQLVVHTDITEALTDIHADLILVDLSLPLSDDAETLAKIRTLFPTNAIIPISGVMPLEIDEWIGKYQLKAFLSKDDLLTELLPIIQNT
jgi:DNA-binding NarL/FixJ family response regulator